MLSLGFKELISMERQYGNKGRAEQRLGSDSSYWPRGRGERALPTMANTAGLHSKGVTFSGFRCMKGQGFHLLKYMTG